jgi:hypothetical protein
METTNARMSIKEKTLNFMEIAFEIAVETGENEVTIKTCNGILHANIQTNREIYLKKVQDIAGDIQVTISSCDYGLNIYLYQEL